ncbi:MAG TPA: hypothetical protein VF618_19705 [Thermoanaerobaculia bacterium]
MNRRQRAIFWIVALLCASTRFLAKARTLWEWDEILFCLGMRDFDIALHHPHPPGFPIFIGLAKLVRLVADSDFHALQTINLVAAALAFPVVYLFARQVGLRFSWAVVAGALFAFFPNVWLFGGTAFSDVPSIVLVTFAATLLLRAANGTNATDGTHGSRRNYFLGTLLLALAMGIRPQNLLVGLVPGILATRKRRWWEILVALLIGVVVLSVAFGAAIQATGGFERYLDSVRAHGDYISTYDSFRSPVRPALWRLFDRFFIKNYQSIPLSFLTSIFVIVSIVGTVRERYRPMLVNILTFAPFALFAWLMLDRYSISRFSIGYAPMFALLAADGLRRVTRDRPLYSAALVAAFALWTAPALTPVRRDIAPPLLAIEKLQQVRPAQLYVAHTMWPFVEYLAPGADFVRVLDDRAMPISDAADPWLLAELNRGEATGHVFRRERGRLWKIARRHYFDVVLRPMTRRAQFLAGWYPAEGGGIDEWRWMGARSVTVLPGATGEQMLRLQLTMPVELVPRNATVTVTLNGRVLERVTMTGNALTRDFDDLVPAPDGAPNTLVLTIDQTFHAPDDGRELGLSLRMLGWGRS